MLKCKSNWQCLVGYLRLDYKMIWVAALTLINTSINYLTFNDSFTYMYVNVLSIMKNQIYSLHEIKKHPVSHKYAEKNVSAFLMLFPYQIVKILKG